MNVIDSARPLNFLSEPDPIKSFDLLVSVSDENLNNPVPTLTLPIASAAPDNAKSVPVPSSETSSGNAVLPSILNIGGVPSLTKLNVALGITSVSELILKRPYGDLRSLLSSI